MNQIIVVLIVTLTISFSQSSKVEQDVATKLLKDYDIKIRPSSDPSDSVHVIVDLYLLKLTNIDEAKGEASLGLWVGMTWNDSRLSWKPSSDNKNLKKLILPSTQVWVPDMVMYTGEGVLEKSLGPNENFHLTVQSSGEVYYLYPINERVPCIRTAEKSGLECAVSFESWTLPLDLLTLMTTKKAIDTNLLGTYFDPKYKIKSTEYGVKTITYPDIPDEKYHIIKSKILLEHKTKRQTI